MYMDESSAAKYCGGAFCVFNGICGISGAGIEPRELGSLLAYPAMPQYDRRNYPKRAGGNPLAGPGSGNLFIVHVVLGFIITNRHTTLTGGIMIKKVLALATLFAFLAMSTVALAGDDAEKEKVEKAAHGEYTGTLVCLGCSLKGEGANAQCADFGHTHALKTEDGKYLTFLPNKFSSNLLAGEKFHEKAVAVHGVYYANANQLDVQSYTIDGKDYGWCDHCTAMDGCAIAKK